MTTYKVELGTMELIEAVALKRYLEDDNSIFDVFERYLSPEEISEYLEIHEDDGKDSEFDDTYLMEELELEAIEDSGCNRCGIGNHYKDGLCTYCYSKTR